VPPQFDAAAERSLSCFRAMIDVSYLWQSLPEPVKEWIIKISVTIAIALAWHWWCQRQAVVPPPPRNHDPHHVHATHTTRKIQQGVDRAALDPLPQDLLLEERVEDTEDTHVSDTHINNNPDDDTSEDTTFTAEKESEDTPQEALNNVARNDTTTANRRSDTSLSGQTLRNRSTVTPSSSQNVPVFRNKSREHPGLEHFWRWCDIECSLFRVYSLGGTNDNENDIIPPFIPHSRRGNVKVSLQVINRTGWTILVYWKNYKGTEDFKGRIQPNTQWNQQTWIEHPWVFRDEATGRVLVHYIPERIIPHCTMQPTVDENDTTVGVHRFIIDMARDEDNDDSKNYLVEIQDSVLPFPARKHFKSIEQAVDFALLHMHRMNYQGWDVLIKYLTNILFDPGNSKFRCIRIANPKFSTNVWQTPAKGLLLAIGFVEHGAYVELGTAKPLLNDQKKMLSTILFSINIWKQKQLPAQPVGADDGFGRAGFGRAGDMNF
jgi:hypothetical protein